MGEDLLCHLEVRANPFLYSAAHPPVPGRHYDFQIYNCLQVPMLHSILLPYTYDSSATGKA